MTRPIRLVCLTLCLGAAPAHAQTAADVGGGTPEEVLAGTWAEALGGAEAVAWALGDVAGDTTGAAPETLGEAGRARATAAVAAAATSATLVAALQFSIALADSTEQPTVVAALAEDALGLHTLLLLVAETVDPPPADPTLRRAEPVAVSGMSVGTPDDAPAGSSTDWAACAAQIRALASRLGGAVSALGLAAPRP